MVIERLISANNYANKEFLKNNRSDIVYITAVTCVTLCFVFIIKICKLYDAHCSIAGWGGGDPAFMGITLSSMVVFLLPPFFLSQFISKLKTKKLEPIEIGSIQEQAV